jgi:hypothetical protein
MPYQGKTTAERFSSTIKIVNGVRVFFIPFTIMLD